MNEEEKQAIHYLKDFRNNVYNGVGSGSVMAKNLNLIFEIIEKQQKEIEELSIIKNSIQTLETHFVNDDTYYVIAKENFLEGDFRHLLDDYISKDKIKEKIQELEDMSISQDIYFDDVKKLFEELLGE